MQLPQRSRPVNRGAGEVAPPRLSLPSRPQLSQRSPFAREPRAEPKRAVLPPRPTIREMDGYADGKSLAFREMSSTGKLPTGTPKGLPPRKTQVAETERAPAFSRRTSVTEAVRSINTVERPQPTDARMGVTYQRPEVTKLTPLNKRDQASPHYQPPLANFDRPAVNQSPPYTGGSTPHFPHFYGRK